MNEIPGRSASGVRLSGDDYQHLVTWNEVLHGLLPDSGVRSVAVEDAEAASVDDVVVRYDNARVRYVQVKHTVDAATPVGSEWLTARRGNGRSVLQKFFDSWKALGGADVPIEMELVTDRELDRHDPLIQCFDAASERLTPLIASGNLSRQASEQRAAWAQHVGGTEEELVRMLDDLRLRTGRPHAAEVERATLLMRLHGLAHDQQAFDSAISLVREWVQDRWRELSIPEISERIAARVARYAEPWSLVEVEGIDDSPAPTAAAARLRFVELYESDDPYFRRQLRDPADWQGVYKEMVAAADRLRAEGRHRVLVKGSMRLPMWFAIGAALRHVRGFTVATEQGGQLWASDQGAPGGTVQPGDHDVALGSELAIVVSVANDVTESVLSYVRDAQLPVGQLLSLSPLDGPGNEVVQSGADAAQLALAARDAARSSLAASGSSRIHLFLSTPAGFALLLGHRWNALAATIVYEHLGGAKYVETMTLPA
jgi:hypothetical protein